MKKLGTSETTPVTKFLLAVGGGIAFASFISVTLSAVPTQTPARPEFDAVSIKPSPPGQGVGSGGGSVLPSGRLQMRAATLKYLMSVAYSVTNYQIFGSHDLLESQRYDVVASAGHPVDSSQIRLMLQSALEDILKLKYHRETRELPIYWLVLAKPGVKGGPGLVEDPGGDCAASSGEDTTTTSSAPDAVRVPCGNVNLIPFLGRITARRGRILQLIDRLSTVLERPVVDKTGLTGIYNFTLVWTPEPASSGAAPMPGVDPLGPTIFTAVQEQLGLKLEAGKGPVEVVVLDSVSKLP